MAAVRAGFQSIRFTTRLLTARLLCTKHDGQTGAKVPSFDDERVKSLLKTMSGCNLDKIFAARKEALAPPTYQLMTEEEVLQVGLATIRKQINNTP